MSHHLGTSFPLGQIHVDLSEIPSVALVFDTADILTSANEFAPLLFPSVDPRSRQAIVKPLTQGTTNHLYKVTFSPSEKHTTDSVEDEAIIKVYGDGTDITIDRRKELAIHKLISDRHLGSPILLRFENGHAYGFLRGSLCSEDMIHTPAVWHAVASELGRWHATLPAAKLGSHQEALSFQPSIWATARKWIDAIPAGSQTWGIDKDQLRGEFQHLATKLLCGSGGAPEPLILSHGDLLCGNIILQQEAPVARQSQTMGARFIDYEHATYAPRAFELANHFAEWAGFECDYTRLPSRTDRRAFLRVYLEALREHGMQSGLAPTGPPEVTEIDVNKLMQEVDSFRGFPGFYWGLCAIIQAETSTGTIDFDYKSYAQKRLAEYWEWRNAEDERDKGGSLWSRERLWSRE